jgi:hypothetical protein
MALEVRPLGEFHPFGLAYARENGGVNIGSAARDATNGATRPVTNAGTPHLPLSLSMPALDLGAATPDAAILMRGAMGAGDASGQSMNAPKSLTGCYSLGEVPSASQHSLSVAVAMAEEELYVVGTTVVWSRGCHGAGTGTLKASFNFEHLKQPIRQCLWARFRTGDADDAFATASASSTTAKRSRADSAASDMDLEEEVKRQSPTPDAPATDRALCVLFRDVASFQFDDGRSYLVNLPFAVHRAFALPGPAGGLLLQKEATEQGTATRGSLDPSEQPLLAYNATLFSLMHPLEQPRVIGVFRDPAPGIGAGTSTRRLLSTGSLSFDDAAESVVFVSSGSGTPLVVTFNNLTGKHSAWTFLHSVVDAADRAATFQGAVPPAPTSPLLARPTAKKTTDSARRGRPRRPQSHAPKRSSILPAGPETPQFIGRLDDERRTEMPTDEDDEYQRAIVAWQTSPIVFFRKIWEEPIAA